VPGRVPNTSVGEVLVKILDMGLALLQMPEVEEAGETLTQKGILLGTPDFIAAEQASNPHNADIRSDLYSLGCTFYYLLTGRVPFPGGTTIDKLFRHRLEEPTSLGILRPDVPESVAAVVRKLMAKLPSDRYQTPGELADHLYEVMTGLRRQGGAVKVPRSTAETAAPVEETPAPEAIPESGDKPSAASAPSAFSRLPRREPLPGKPAALFRRHRKAIVVCLAAAFALTCGVGVLFSRGGWSSPKPASSEAAASAPSIPALGRKYVLKNTREETILATLRANGLPALDGKWYVIGPFDYHDPKTAFTEAFSPEKESFSPDKSCTGKWGKTVFWKEFPGFKPGTVASLRIFDDDEDSCCYLYHCFTVEEPVDLPVLYGFDDTGIIWLNGKQVVSRGPAPGWVHDQRSAVLKCNPGKNELLIKVCNQHNLWELFLLPTFPPQLESTFGPTLKRDFSKPTPRPSEPGKHGAG
jgi:hypothetical protein